MKTHLDQNRVDELFLQASELPADERAALLDSACGGDDKLRAEVEKLLAAHNKPTAFLAPPQSDKGGDETEETNDPLVGEQIGPYEVKRRLGGGGFGDVYLAARTKEYQQLVAIKVVRDQARDLPRFELERQLLADLQHEHIARLLDGGTLVDGRPYIVMEYIAGEPVTTYCDEHRLPIKQRLALFAQVCQALAFAHRYGVIHRDIKPDNILVTADGQVKLLDFGIAKMLDSRARPGAISPAGPATVVGNDGAETVSMAFDSSLPGISRASLGLAPMTPAYASPEQVRGQEVSTASDIYSLGVVLYELLAGRRPYDTPRFRPDSSWLAELQQVVCEQIPPAPSMAVSSPLSNARAEGNSAVASPAATAAARGTTTKQLQKLLSGDLESITMKALGKDPERRYPAVDSLLDDLSRFEKGFPVDARPVTRRERAMRWVARNKLVATLASTAVLALVVGAVASTLFGLDAGRQAAAAIARENETAAILDFVETKIFAAARPQGQEGGLGKDVTLRQSIDAALPFVEASFSQQPIIAARLRSTLGTSFQYLGEPKIAKEQFEAASKLYEEVLSSHHAAQLKDDVDVFGTMYNLGLMYSFLQRDADALKMNEESLAGRLKTLGAEHPHTLLSMNNLAINYFAVGRRDEAIELHEKALDIRKRTLGPQHHDTLGSMANLTAVYCAGGRLDEAYALCQQILGADDGEVRADRADLLGALSNVAQAYHEAGRLDEEISLYEQLFEARLKRLGTSHPETLASMNNLAVAYRSSGRLAEAIPLYEKSRDILREKLGPDHPHTLISMQNLANSYRIAGRLDESLHLYEQVVPIMRRKLTDEEPDTLTAMNNLARAYQVAGRLDEALALYKSTLDGRRKTLGPDHADTLTTMNFLAGAYRAAGRLDEAIPLYEQTLAARQKSPQTDNRDRLNSLHNLAIAYREAGRFDEAIPLYEQTIEGMRKELGAEHRHTLGAVNDLAVTFCQAERAAAAVPHFERALAAMKKTFGPRHQTTLDTYYNLATAYCSAGRIKDAIDTYDQLLATQPSTILALNGLASILATSPTDSLRNGQRAVELATKACELTNHQDPSLLETLAAAYAEIGDFESAIQWSQKAIELLDEKSDPTVRGRLEDALTLYKDKKPMRDEAKSRDDTKAQSAPAGESTPPAEL